MDQRAENGRTVAAHPPQGDRRRAAGFADWYYDMGQYFNDPEVHAEIGAERRRREVAQDPAFRLLVSFGMIVRAKCGIGFQPGRVAACYDAVLMGLSEDDERWRSRKELP